jgi:hypothetical protein
MFAARADLRAHVTRTHRNPAIIAANQGGSPSATIRRPQRRAASLQRRSGHYAGGSSGAEDDEQLMNEQPDDDFRCPICHRQFTSARLLDRHTFAVHEPRQDSYDDYHNQTAPADEEDDTHDYADDELEEKPKTSLAVKLDHGLCSQAKKTTTIFLSFYR